MTVARNTAYDYVSQVISMVLALAQSVIFPRWPGIEQYGVVLFVVQANAFTQILLCGSIGVAGMFFIGKDRERLGRINTVAIICTLAISLVFFSLMALFPEIGIWIAQKVQNPNYPSVPNKYLIIAIALIPISIYWSAWIGMMVGLGAIRKLAIYNVVFTSTQTLVFVVVFAWLRLGVPGFITAWVSIYVLHLLAMWTVLSTEGKIWSGVSWKDILQVLSFSLRAHFGNFAITIISKLDWFFASRLRGPEGFFIYSRAGSMFNYSVMGVDALERAAYKSVTGSDTAESARLVQRMMRNVILLSLLFILIVFPLARIIITTLFTQKAAEATAPLRILLLSLPFYCSNRVLAMYVTGQLGKPHLSSIFTWMALPVAFGLLVFLTPRFGFSGAAASIGGTYLFLFMLFFGYFLLKTRLTNPVDYLIPKQEDIASFQRYFQHLFRRR